MRPLPFALLLVLAQTALADPGVDLGGHRHVDLSAATPTALPAESKALAATTTLPLPAQSCGDDAPGQLHWLGDDAVAKHAGEDTAIKATNGRVARHATTLTLTPEHGRPLRFTDVVVPATKTTDGDATRFLFTGTLTGTRFWRLETGYQHDAPGSWLVDPVTGDAFFVHNGGAAAVLSTDGRWLVVAELLNAPYQITVTDLAAAPATVRVDCRVVDPAARGSFAACGFEPDGGFRLSWSGEDHSIAALRLAPRTDGGFAIERSPGSSAPVIDCVTLP